MIDQEMSNPGDDVGRWYKCPNCDVCINPRFKFLVHLYAHTNDFGTPPRNQDQAIFHTANGNILKITQLPNTYEIYTPKILFCPIEEIPRRYAFEIRQPRIVLLRQTMPDLLETLQKELTKRKLREKTRRKYIALDTHEDDIIVPGEDESDDSDGDYYEPRNERLEVECEATKRKFISAGSILACVPCKSTFPSLSEYTDHVNEAHYKNGIYFCTDCPFQSALKIAFNKHGRTTCSGLSDKVIKCILCSPVTDWTYRLPYLKHVYSHRVDGKYSCPHCSETKLKLCDIMYHILKMHASACVQLSDKSAGYTRPNYQSIYKKNGSNVRRCCQVCGKYVRKSSRRDNLKKHKRKKVRNTSKPLLCAVCKPDFLGHGSLQFLEDGAKKRKRYNASDSVGSILACVPCKSTFPNLTEYTDHVNEAHYKNGTFFCMGCPFQSALKFAFNKHGKTTCSGVGDKVIKCTLCSPATDWTYRSSYLKHAYSHEVNGKYSCPHCSLTTQNLCDIMDHILKLHDIKNIEHSEKPAGYTRPQYNYKYEKNFRRCEVCGKSFDGKYIDQHLKMHKRKEERNASKPFQCIVCKQGFKRQETLQRHFQVHLEDNPYVCKFPGCGHRSSTKYHLEKHEVLHSERKRFPCEICKVEYSHDSRLREHNKIFHAIRTDETASASSQLSKPKIRFRRRKAVLRIKPPVELPQVPRPRLREPDEDAPRLEGGMSIGSIHLGDDETIKAECQEAMQDVMEDLKVRGIVKSDESTEVGPSAGSSASVMESHLKKDPLLKRLAVEDPDFVRLLTKTRTKYTNQGEQNAFPCKVCVPQVNYSRLYLLITHMKRFHPEEAANNSSELTASSELMFTCGSCGFQTKTSQHLSRHMKTHNPKKLHCPTCGSRFEKQVEVDAHVQRVHLAEKSHKCTKCDKAFTKEKYRIKHEVNVHPPPPKNPDDLICKECGKKFLTMRTLRPHLKLHSKNRTLSYCQICNEKLSCQASLRRHIQLIHVKAKKASEETEIIPESELFL